jgi:2-amino-4-hydroxy-6-hydroxymethyldihydropteridine diphosphokinase
VNDVYLALGANLGDRRANIRAALTSLPPLVAVEAVSPLYESQPQPPSAQPYYLNGACRVTTDLSPRELLRYVKQIEWQLGRRPGERWGPRPIDIDIALYGDQVVDEPDLQVPHPRLAERAFVLRPLLDLDPTLVHPISGVPLARLLAAIGEQDLRPYKD